MNDTRPTRVREWRYQPDNERGDRSRDADVYDRWDGQCEEDYYDDDDWWQGYENSWYDGSVRDYGN